MRKPLARKSNVNRFHLALLQYGVDLSVLYDSVGISLDQMESVEGTVAMPKFLALLERAAVVVNAPYLAMQIVKDPSFQNIGILKYLVRNSSDLARALDSVHRFVALVSPGAKTDLLIGPEEAVVTYEHSDVPADMCRQDVEGTLMQFVLMMRELLGNEAWEPTCLYLQHGRPEVTAGEVYPIDCKIVHHHAISGMAFSKELLQCEIRTADTELFTVLEERAEKETRERSVSGSFGDAVYSVVVSLTTLERVTAGSVASHLHCSERTLHRKLRQHGQTFTQICDRVVLRLAKQHLVETDLSVLQIAIELGFSDATGFIRSFKKQVNQTPLQYRKQQRLDLSK